MVQPELAAREIEPEDIDHLMDYWYNASPEYMRQMGADSSKLPAKTDFRNMLMQQIAQPYPEKKTYATIWTVDGEPVGHCNTNQIEFGDHAFMHLHLWHPMSRGLGWGQQLVLLSLPYFFELLQLKNLICEPNALNPAPNKTLEKIGFTFVKRYTTVPGSLNFEQEVNRWVLSREDFFFNPPDEM